MGVGWGFNLKEKDKYLPGYCVMLCESSVNVELVMPWTNFGKSAFFFVTSTFQMIKTVCEPVCEARGS